MTLWLAVTAGLFAHANPYPYKEQVPVDGPRLRTAYEELAPDLEIDLAKDAVEVLRVQVEWDEKTDTFGAFLMAREWSGTPALVRRAAREDELGSYKGLLRDPSTGEAVAHDAIGTGQEFRRLTRALTFRFPVPSRPMTFELRAENPQTGALETVLRAPVDPGTLPMAARPSERKAGPVVRLLKAAKGDATKLLLNIYAEGYSERRKDAFFEKAGELADIFAAYQFPLLDRMEIRAVFAPSRTQLGAARKLGHPVPERDSFLGLYYPYWRDFGRWYHVVYPTREAKYRAAIGQTPYDYPLILVDSDEYWGVGNYKELTAIPSGEPRLAYLLLHEIGHFFGLNEEYEGGGPTELAFAPGVAEPWSPNITFLRDRAHASLKWNRHVAASTPLPTPVSLWSFNPPVYGAYEGGYGDTDPRGHSHKPGLGCVMDRHRNFCAVCREALERVIRRDLGE